MPSGPLTSTDDEKRDDLSSPVAESREDAILRALMNTLNEKSKAAWGTEDDVKDDHDLWNSGYSYGLAEAASIIASVLKG